jgi:hypothetical protein
LSVLPQGFHQPGADAPGSPQSYSPLDTHAPTR